MGLFSGHFRVVVGPFWLSGSRSKKGLEMFDKTRQKLTTKYVEPVQRSVAAAVLIAAAALVFAFLAFVRSV
jgi:hypothetical protein